MEGDDGCVALYMFGGQPDARGTYPRHAAITAEYGDDGFCVVLSTYGGSAEIFEVAPNDAAHALRRIAAFLQGASIQPDVAH